MIALTREEAQQVLETIGKVFDHNDWQSYETTVDLLRARLAQPEPEPVAGYRWEEGRTPPSVSYTAPPQRVYCSCGDGIVPDDGALCGTCVSLKKMREWQGLTDEEIMSLLPGAVRLPPGWSETVRAIEAKLKEKNA
jgi:hypothetical protein